MAATTAGPGTALASWRDGPAKHAIIDFVAHDRRRAGCRPRSGSPCSTTTARCGARSRCRSSSTSSCAAWPRWPTPIRPCASASRGRPPASGLRLARRVDGRALRRRRHQRAGAGRRHPGRLRRDERRGVRGALATAFLRDTRHPTLGRGYLECVYAPMVELLDYLDANEFSNYIVSGGGRDFMRPISRGVRHPARARHRQQRRARATRATTAAGRSRTRPELDFFDDGPEKPVRIWSRTGRRPLLAAGNSNGDVPMLRLRPARGQAVAAPARAPRRRRSGSSPTPAAPSRRSSGRRPRAGPSSASRTTGSPSSDGAAAPVPPRPRPRAARAHRRARAR